MQIYCYGLGMADTILYITLLLKRLGKKVLIVDKTRYLQLISCIPWEMDSISVMEFRGIDFTMDYPLKDVEEQEEYEVVFILEDFVRISNLDKKGMLGVVYFSDYEKCNILALERMIQNLPYTACIILNHEIDGKINQEYLERSDLFISKKIEKVYSHMLIPRTTELSLLAQYQCSFQLKVLSREYQGMLKELIVRWFPAITDKMFWKAFRSREVYK